jgi:hypothetical protein
MKCWKLDRVREAEILLTLVFVASFVPYVTGITLERQLIAVGMLLAVAFIIFPVAFPWRVGRALRGFLHPKFILIALILPIAPTIIAINFGKWNAVAYALLMLGVLAACHVVLYFIPLRTVLRGFARAGIVATALFLVSDYHDVLHSAISGARLVPPEMQPNVLAFMFVGFAIAFAGRAADGMERYWVRAIYSIGILANVIVIFLAQSRASMLALACGVAWVVAMWCMRALHGRKRIVRSIVVALCCIPIAIGVYVALRPSAAAHGAAYVSHALQLTSSYRGVGTGFSGRLDSWKTTIDALGQHGAWAFGNGYRTSMSDLGLSVDNGYLTVAYEMGVFGLLVILGQLIWCEWLVTRRYIAVPEAFERRYFMLIGGLLAAFLINNIFDRYLFGLGNPFSLIGLFFLLARRKDVGLAPYGVKIRRDSKSELARFAPFIGMSSQPTTAGLSERDEHGQ